MRRLDHVAQRVAARVVGVPERLRHERRHPLALDVAALRAGRRTSWGYRDLGHRPLPTTDDPKRRTAGDRVRAATEHLLVPYDNQGVWTSSESLSLGLPDCDVNDMPYAGDQRSEGPVAADDDLAMSSPESC